MIQYLLGLFYPISRSSCLLARWGADVGWVSVGWWQRGWLMISSNWSSDALLQNRADIAVVVHFVWGAEGAWIAPRQESSLCKALPRLLAAPCWHSSMVAFWKGQKWRRRNMPSPNGLGKECVRVLAHTQNIDSSIFFPARWASCHCMPVSEFHMLLSLPSKLKLLILPFKAFMLTSQCFCLFVIASSCLRKAAFVVFFHPRLHLFRITLDDHGAAVPCLRYCGSPLGKAHCGAGRAAVCPVAGSHPVGRGTRWPGFVSCPNDGVHWSLKTGHVRRLSQRPCNFKSRDLKIGCSYLIKSEIPGKS